MARRFYRKINVPLKGEPLVGREKQPMSLDSIAK